MSCARRVAVGPIAWLLLCPALWGAAGGCKEDAPGASEPDPSAAGEAPADDGETRLVEARLPAPRPMPEALVPADDSDDTTAPACLPRSDSVPGWIKTEPARVVGGSEFLEQMEDANRVAEIGSYRIVEATHCRYEKIDDAARLSVSVELVRCQSASDAFGLWSTQRAGEAIAGMSQVWGRRTGPSYRLHAWQSNCYLRAEGRPAKAPRLIAEAERLVGRILLALPRVDPPPLVRCLPCSKVVVLGRWFARRSRSLTACLAGVLSAEQAGALDRILELPRSQGIAVAAYEAGEGEPPNYVWLVEYATPAEAQAAYGRYGKVVDGLAGGDRTVPPVPPALLLSPVGRFLGGSWSPEQESEMHLLSSWRGMLSNLEAGGG